MGQVDLPQIEPMGNKSLEQYVRYLADMVAIMQEELQNLLEGRLGSDNIRANSIVANRMDVQQLSAITADMGELTAGKITGAVIQNQTAEGNRVWLDAQGFHAKDASGIERITIGTTPAKGAKAIIGRNSAGVEQSVYTYDTETVDGGSRTGQYITAHGIYILLGADGYLRIQDVNGRGFRTQGSGNPEMNTGFGWVKIARADTSTSSHTQPNHDHGIDYGVKLATTDDGSTVSGYVTWVPSGGFTHSHTQN